MNDLTDPKDLRDPRWKSPTPIPTRPPLPFISRKALRAIKHPFYVGDVCKCGAKIELLPNSVIYGRSYGDWPYVYACTVCDSYVGVHSGTDIAIGSLADRKTREARKKSKAVFQKMQNVTRMSRNDSYTKLSELMGIPREITHFGMFDVDACELAEVKLNEFLNDYH